MYSMIVCRLISEHGNHLPNYADSQSSFWKNVWVSGVQNLNFLAWSWESTTDKLKAKLFKQVANFSSFKICPHGKPTKTI